MDLESIQSYCRQKAGTTEDFPFGLDVMTFRVGRKMFAMVRLDISPLRINLKCDPLMAESLRQEFPAITPGYYMNKRHWNTVTLDGSIKENKILFLIDHSYELVYKSLPKATRIEIGQPKG
jgi:predicted DNA-binding protein (MmcQ/YjbR family)